MSRGPRVPSYATKQGAQSARESHVLASNFAKYSLLLNVAIIWLLTAAPHRIYVAKLPCNLSLIACFVTLVLQGSVARYTLITTHSKFTEKNHTRSNGIVNNEFTPNLPRNLPVKKKLESRLRFDRIMSFWSHNFWPTVYNNKNQCHNCKQHESSAPTRRTGLSL